MKKLAVSALLIAIPFFTLVSSFSSAAPLLVPSENTLSRDEQSDADHRALKPAQAEPGSHRVYLPLLSKNFLSCDHVIETWLSTADGRTNYAAVQAGDTVCIAAGTRGDLKLQNFEGTAENPIVFVNAGGPVIIASDTSHGILFQNSRHFRLTGTGIHDIEYGIRIVSSTNVGVQAAYKSSDFEIDHIEVSGASGAGIMAKTKAVCSDGSTNDYDYDFDGIIRGDLDDVVNRSNFTTRNLRVHDNYIHSVGAEGFYIGSSHYGGKEASCSGNVEMLYPPVLQSVSIFDNRIIDAGWDGIQVGSAIQDCNIHHNDILRDSRANELYQQSGIMNNPGSVCNIYSNHIQDGGGPGIFVQGNGGNIIYNNVIVNAGQNEPLDSRTGNGITVYTGSNTGNNIYVLNNTIVAPRNLGIKFKNAQGDENRVQNNIIIAPGSYDSYGDAAYIQTEERISVEISHNYTSQSSEGMGFAEPDSGNFALIADSPAVDVGINWDLGVGTADKAGTARPQGRSYDAGAYECILY
ncbi:MAG: right-handed parallel beta-helix repeat-containing protein [Chloroflexota bacterium]